MELVRINEELSRDARVVFWSGNITGRIGWVQGGFTFEKYAIRKGTESRREERRSEFVAFRGVDPLRGVVSPERTDDTRPRARNYGVMNSSLS